MGVTPIVQRIQEMEEYTDPDAGGSEAATFEREVTVEDLSFGYSKEQPVVNGINLKIERGKKICAHRGERMRQKYAHSSDYR